MVLSQRHVSMPQTRARAAHAKETTKLDATRIAGMAAAMAVNIAAMMLLLVPVSPPSAPVSLRDDGDIFVQREEIKPPPPPPRLIVEVTKPQPKQPTQARQEIVKQPPMPQTIETQQTVVPNGNEYIEPQPVIDPVPDAGNTQTAGTGGPQEATRLEYASAPAPAYPRDAIMEGLQGTVYLKVLVDVDGTPLSVEIHRSSGHRKLDDAARRQVLKKWKFRPAMQDGQAIQVYGIVPVDFSLSRQ